MTLQELFDISRLKIKVKSGYNDKVLCREYTPDKHTCGNREVVAVWAEMRTVNTHYSCYAVPIMCVYVDGAEELREEIKKENEQRN